jgi:hypothetical protein
MSIISSPYFTPNFTGCSLWLDGADPAGNGTIPSNGSSLASWTDKSGNGLTVSAASSQPTYATNTLNGLGTVAFNGTQGLNAGSVTGGKLLANNGSSAIFCVFSVSNNTENSCPFSWDDSGYTYRLMITWAGAEGTPGLEFDLGNFPCRTQIATTGPSSINFTNNTYYLVSFWRSGTTTVLNINGKTYTSIYTDFSGNWSSTVSRIFNVGTYVNSGSYNMKGSTAEILFYNTNIPSNFQQVEAYLAQKWGLTSSLPAGHIGLLTKLYASSTQSIKVTPYTSVSYAFAPTQISGCQLWLDGADPAGTGVVPASGTLATWTDKSTAGNNATGGVSPTYSSTTNAVSFNGSSSYLQTSLSAVPSNETFFAVFTSTVPTSSANRFNCIIGASGNNGRDINVLTSSAGNSSAYDLRYDSWAVGSISLTGYGGITFNTLTLATTQFTGGQGAGSTYGSNFGSFQSLSFSGSSTTRIGTGNGGDYFTGTINEIIIYNTVLGSTDRQKVEAYLAQKWGIRSSLAASHPGLTTTYYLGQSMVTRAAITTPTPATKIPINLTGLIIYFSFDNAIFDLYNLTSLSLTGSFSYVTGRRGQAISLTNTAGVAPTNYLSSSYVLPSVFTISLWFQTPNVSNGSMVFCANSNVSLANGSISIYFTGGNLFCAYSDVVNNATAFAISANTWYHTVLTYNSGSTTLYVNGSQSGNTITGTNSKNGFTFGGGRDTLTQYPFSGYIDDFRIYSRVLTSTEITAIYNNLG